MTQTTVICPSKCEITVKHEISIPALDLTTTEAAQIGLSIILVWAVGWAFRTLIRFLQSGGISISQEET